MACLFGAVYLYLIWSRQVPAPDFKYSVTALIMLTIAGWHAMVIEETDEK